MVIEVRGSRLYIGGLEAEGLAERFGTPLFVYDRETVVENYGRLVGSFTYRRVEVLYSCKANSNPGVLGTLRDLGAGVDASSPWEALLAVRLGFPREKIMLTSPGLSDEEMRFVRGELGVLVNVDSLSQLRRYGRLFPETEVSVRVNPGFGAGYHEFTTTGGLTKFGIGLGSLGRALEVAREHGLRVVGLHAHIGSGILSVEPYARLARTLLDLARGLPHVEFVDIGGGMGVPQRPGEREFDCAGFGRVLSRIMEEHSRDLGDVKLRMEPGRFIVASAGVLLTRVVEVREVEVGGSRRVFAVVDSSINHLPRVAMMGMYYEVVHASRAGEPAEAEVDVVGNLCVAGDVLARARKLPRLEEGDVLAFLNAGAYAYSTSMNYNTRPRPAEVLVYRGEARLTRRRETFEDLVSTMVF